MTTHVLSKYWFPELNIVSFESNVSSAVSCLKSNEGKIELKFVEKYCECAFEMQKTG
jgi:hypothetical protein